MFFMIPVPSEPRNCAPESPASAVPPTIKAFEKATFAEPSTLLPAKVLAVVHLAAEPVVFWLRVGNEVNEAALPLVASKVAVPVGRVYTPVSSAAVKDIFFKYVNVLVPLLTPVPP